MRSFRRNEKRMTINGQSSCSCVRLPGAVLNSSLKLLSVDNNSYKPLFFGSFSVKCEKKKDKCLQEICLAEAKEKWLREN